LPPPKAGSNLDIFDVVQDVRTKTGTEGLARHHFHRLLKPFFEQKREGHEVVEGLFAGGEFDQELSSVGTLR
jgi:hypothetical protein